MMNFPLAFIDGVGGPELLVIMFIILLLFGSDKLPQLAKGMGKTIREFKKAASSVEEEVRRAMDEEPASAKKPAGTIQQGTPEIPSAPPPSAE
jgi:TatA/E family protein of Tat protein translocase